MIRSKVKMRKGRVARSSRVWAWRAMKVSEARTLEAGDPVSFLDRGRRNVGVVVAIYKGTKKVTVKVAAGMTMHTLSNVDRRFMGMLVAPITDPSEEYKAGADTGRYTF